VRLDFIDKDRLTLIPEKFRDAHQFCFYLHDQILHRLREYEASGIRNWVPEQIEKLKASKKVPKKFDLFDFLKKRFREEPVAAHTLACHLTLALTGDFLNFVFEALSCFEKRKLAVGYSLLRKPFKENLLFMCFLLGDLDGFLERFEHAPRKLNGFDPEVRVSVISAAIERMQSKNLFDAQHIHDVIFSKEMGDGFEPYWQQASHLVTSQSKLLSTEPFNLNFVFLNPSSDDLFHQIYDQLPLLMLFATQLSVECFSRLYKPNSLSCTHLLLTTLGVYESLFLKSGDHDIAREINLNLAEFIACLHCKKRLKLTRANTPMAFLAQSLYCPRCKMHSEFPLYWLMGRLNLVVEREGPKMPIFGNDRSKTVA
jgi:hypothetical protein